MLYLAVFPYCIFLYHNHIIMHISYLKNILCTYNLWCLLYYLAANWKYSNHISYAYCVQFYVNFVCHVSHDFQPNIGYMHCYITMGCCHYNVSCFLEAAGSTLANVPVIMLIGLIAVSWNLTYIISPV